MIFFWDWISYKFSSLRFTRCKRNARHIYQLLQFFFFIKICILFSLHNRLFIINSNIHGQLTFSFWGSYAGLWAQGKCQCWKLLREPEGSCWIPEVKLWSSKEMSLCRNVTIHMNFFCALDVETTSVHLIAMQKLTAAPMITRVQGGDTYRRQILWLTHPNFQKFSSCSTPRNCITMTEEVLFRLHYFCSTPKDLPNDKSIQCILLEKVYYCIWHLYPLVNQKF